MDNMSVENKYLSFSRFKLLNFWDYYTLSNKSEIHSKYDLVELSDVLTQRKEYIVIDDNKEYKRCRVQTRAQGVVLRDEVYGKVIKTKKQQPCKTNDFLVAEIDAKVGGYGIVPNYLEGAIVSSHYFLFAIDKKKLLPEFLSIVVKCNDFFKQIKATGSTNYAAIRPHHVLGYLIPLPSLLDQNRIVEAYNEKIRLAEEQAQKADELEKGIEKFLSEELGIERGKRINRKNGLQTIAYKEINRWALSYIFKEQRFSMENVKYPILPLKSIITFFEGGKTPSTYRKDFWGGNIFWTSAKDMKELFLENVQDKITEKGVTEGKLKVYPVGTILGVFRSGILRHSFPVALTKIETTINQDLKAIGVDETMVIKEYFLFFLKTFQKFVLERAQKFGVTVESINTDEFLEIPVVLPPLDIQEEICNSIISMLIEIDELRSKSIITKQSAMNEFENEIFMPCN